jgi:alpha-acetolactate decarboxylase
MERNKMNVRCLICSFNGVALWTIAALGIASFVAAQEAAGEQGATASGSLVQYGKMHEVVGQQQHEGRVLLSELTRRPGFFAVAALEELQGEVTILDGEITVTKVNDRGQLEPAVASEDLKAALLVGAYVDGWSEHRMDSVDADGFDQQLAKLAASAGLLVEEPFPFVIDGKFSDVRVHVIHGACPIRARMKKEELPTEKQPFEAEMQTVQGKLVGIFAKDAVGDITHPATSVHMHLLYSDPVTGKTVTGHVEKVAVEPGARVRLPRNRG